MSITDEQKKLLQAHISIMKDNGAEITSKFYAKMFDEHPEMKNFFNQTNQQTGKQPIALAQTVYYFGKNLDNLDVMTPQMSRISSKHRAITVKPEHYPIVGKYLVGAIKEYLGDKGTPQVMAAWQALYDLIAATFMKQEKELYAKLGDDDRDKGFVAFTIVKKEEVAAGPVYVVTLQRQDNGKLFEYAAGQYVTLRIEKDGILHHGQYALLEPFNGRTYSVALKQGNDLDPNSVISEEVIRNRVVGSTVLLSAPAGRFQLAKDAKQHLFISGGIGISSFVALIEELNRQGKAGSATVIQCVRTEAHAAFSKRLQQILTKGQYVILTQENPISASYLSGRLLLDTHVYVSGSEVFLTMAENALEGFAVPQSKLHMKSIEPTLRILKNIEKQTKVTISDEQKKLIQAHLSIMKDNGTEITSKFYATMFDEHPEMKNFFNQTNQQTGKQPMALAQTVYYFAKNLDNLDVMTPQMSRISSRHRAITVKPEHYPIVGKYLMKAIKDYLGDKGTPQVMAAWQSLYDLIAATFIKRENELYAKLGDDDRDKGFVAFTIVKKEEAAAGPVYVVSVKRQDNGKLFEYTPGQYITVRVEKDGVLHHGQYPLLEPFNGSTYSIALKQGNDADQNNIVSTELVRNRVVGSTVLLSAPVGSFQLAKDAKQHVFITGGIGISSFMAVIQDLSRQGKSGSATLFQCVRTEAHALFSKQLQQLLPKGQYSVLPQEEPISKKHLEGKIQPDTHVYVSGSEVFLTMAENALAGLNVAKSQVHLRSIEPTLRILQSIAEK